MSNATIGNTLSLGSSAKVALAANTGTVSLNDGGNATYDVGRSTPSALAFDYTVQSGQSTAALAVTGFSSNGATIEDTTGNSADFSGVPTAFAGLGVNVAATAALASAVHIPIIALGGVSGMSDIEALMAAPTRNILGVVIGRALYDGRIDSAAALQRARRQ